MTLIAAGWLGCALVALSSWILVVGEGVRGRSRNFSYYAGITILSFVLAFCTFRFVNSFDLHYSPSKTGVTST